MACDSTMSWSTADPELMATWLSADAVIPRLSCFTRGSPEHMASACPNKFSGTSSGLRCPVCSLNGHLARSCPTLARAPNNQRQQKPPGAGQTNPTTIPDNKVCKVFNQKGHCFRGTRCPSFHVCTKCKGGHPEQACPDRT